jgi:hypothetical protein
VPWVCAVLVMSTGSVNTEEALRKCEAPVPTRADTLQGPGADIGFGLSVVPGSCVLGGRFEDLLGTISEDRPEPDVPPVEEAPPLEPGLNTLGAPRTPGSGVRRVEGWSATLVVGEHPLEVFQAYVDQAVAAGFGFDPSPGGPCSVEVDGDSFPLAEWRSGPVDQVVCSDIGQRRRRDGGERAVDSLGLFLVRGRPTHCDADPCTESYASYLRIHAVDSDPVDYGGGRVRRGPDVTGLSMPELLPVPEGLRVPRRPGDRVGAQYGFFDGFSLENGSEAVAPGASIFGSHTGHFEVILRLTGDPRRVLKAYGDQFVPMVFGSPPVEAAPPPAHRRFKLEKRTVHGVEQFYGYVSAAGGLLVDVVTTSLASDGPVYAKVTVEND